MNPTQKELVILLSKRLFKNADVTATSNEVIHEAKMQAVSSLVSDDYQTIANNIRVNNAHVELTKVLKDIPFVTLKGYASAYYYPDPIRRPMGDVDFYVDNKHYDLAKKRLIACGFKKSGSEHERHETFIKGNVHFELHSEIKGIPNGKDGINTNSPTAEKAVRNYLESIIEKSKRVNYQNGIIVIPNRFHHGLIMLLHVAGHIINDGGVGLRHLCDWAVYVDKVDISMYNPQLMKMGLWTFACQLTAVSTKYLGLKEKPWCLRFNDEFLKEFMEDIISAGNFGHKGKYRGIINKTSGKQSFISSVLIITRKKYPITESYPVLLPFAVVWWGISYFVKCLLGRRDLIKPKDLHDGKRRMEFYKQFRLFENAIQK